MHKYWHNRQNIDKILSPWIEDFFACLKFELYDPSSEMFQTEKLQFCMKIHKQLASQMDVPFISIFIFIVFGGVILFHFGLSFFVHCAWSWACFLLIKFVLPCTTTTSLARIRISQTSYVMSCCKFHIYWVGVNTKFTMLSYCKICVYTYPVKIKINILTVKKKLEI